MFAIIIPERCIYIKGSIFCSCNCSTDQCRPVLFANGNKADKTFNMLKLILIAIAVVAVSGVPVPEPEPAPEPAPAHGPVPPLVAPYPVVYTAPYVKVYPYHPVPLAYYNSYKWIHPGSAYVY
ncbi:uncharacterized protein LOC105202685 [Solenopsis invicta]|uniref:uncharacterized protein LOC105202685 n=1 Tax=Solenopsis invicta TaxID=13686 RepID=UPI00193D21E4|nr:uncharacterized protein LOC105202685 [Solenopsis invicta]